LIRAEPRAAQLLAYGNAERQLNIEAEAAFHSIDLDEAQLYGQVPNARARVS
jgi:hypothetical protein